LTKVLVTGVNGLLGQKLIFLLAQHEGIEIVASGRGKARIDFGNIQYLDLDLSDRKSVMENVTNCNPTHIIHSAAMTQVDHCEQQKETCWKNNVLATENIVAVSKKLGTYLQFISTDFIFDGHNGPYSESDMPNPINYYGISKLRAEEIVAASGLDWSIVRTVLVYGVGKDLSRSNLVLWAKQKLENGEQIRVVNDQWRNPTLVEDLAKGCQLILDAGAHGIYNIAGREYLTPFDVAIATADVFALDKNLISPTNASEFIEIAQRPLKTGFDISKAKNELGYEPVSLERGIITVKDQLAS